MQMFRGSIFAIPVAICTAESPNLFFFHKEGGRQSPLAVRAHGTLTADEQEQVFHVADTVRSEIDSFLLRGELLVANRSFGPGGASHETLFLHRHMDRYAPQLRKRLEELAAAAEEASGWNLTRGLTLRPRCLELLTYEGGYHLTPVRWHGDGATLITMVIMLSNASQYSGGAVELRDYGEDEDHELKEWVELTGHGSSSSSSNLVSSRPERHRGLIPGDAVAWRGWTLHRAAAVLSGQRQVLASEWWLGPDCSKSGLPRAPDTPRELRRAVYLDPKAAQLRRWLGGALCEQPPCASRSHALAALAAYQQAVALAPQDLRSLIALQAFLDAAQREFSYPKAEADDPLNETVQRRKRRDLQRAKETSGIRCALLLLLL
eukprot:TRINITY_DN69709_c0_g1_i1.p1 TRINITY_DN69709_c0_g1~~TRINITY_DN69709_c0_g1_i1.p1  ORF type:complete len:377 (+),score=73.42 TRINITY_DN69709_c0_g1_i1:40-1170(+)